MLNARLFEFWIRLGSALMTWLPQSGVKVRGKSIFEEFYARESELGIFLESMTGFQYLNFQQLADKFDFSQFRSLSDIGGAFIAAGNLIDDARRENAFGLLMSLNMLIEFGDAFDYTAANIREWCTEAGFYRFEVVPLAGPTSAAVAYK